MKVSAFERAASWLLAALTLLGSVTIVLVMIWIGGKVTVTPTAVPVTMDRIKDNADGGFENGVFGQDIEIKGGVTGQLGSVAEAAEEPVQQALEMVSGLVAAQRPLLDDINPRERFATDGIGGSRGTGIAPALGEDGGSGGVKRNLRWTIDYAQASSIEVYAAQLDEFGIELGAVSLAGDERVQYASHFTKTPVRKEGPKEAEKRLYFSWNDGELQQADRELLTRAGIDPAGKEILQFYPQATEVLLADLEMKYLMEKAPPDRQNLRWVRRTRFGVRGSTAAGFKFYVKSQIYLGNSI